MICQPIMKLVGIQVEGYKSIREPIDVPIDPAITVFLGANDHGKTNLLDAIARLNGEKTLDAEVDIN